MNLNVISYNIHKGKSFIFQKPILNKIKDYLHDLSPDIVFLQEVMGEDEKEIYCLEDRWDNQFEYLADAMWSHHAYSKNAIYDKGHHGNVILSKYPIVDSFKVDISTNPFEKRGALFAEISVPVGQGELSSHQSVYCICVHLNLLSGGRREQYALISKILEEHVPVGAPVILAGDFNDWNKKASLSFQNILDFKESYKEKYGKYAKTFPAIFPLLSLDRIYIKGVQAHTPVKIKRGMHIHKLSDHLPVMVRVEV